MAGKARNAWAWKGEKCLSLEWLLETCKIPFIRGQSVKKPISKSKVHWSDKLLSWLSVSLMVYTYDYMLTDSLLAGGCKNSACGEAVTRLAVYCPVFVMCHAPPGDLWTSFWWNTCDTRSPLSVLVVRRIPRAVTRLAVHCPVFIMSSIDRLIDLSNFISCFVSALPCLTWLCFALPYLSLLCLRFFYDLICLFMLLCFQINSQCPVQIFMLNHT